MEKGELQVKITRAALFEEIIDPILTGLEGGITEQKMVVESSVPRAFHVEADKDLLRIVYDNLLANAIKYGREGGRIALEAEEREEEIALSVYNEGEGIPPEKMSSLFQKFSRLDNRKGKKGTGLNWIQRQ